MSAIWDRKNELISSLEYIRFAICDIEVAQKKLKYKNEYDWWLDEVWKYLHYAINNLEVSIFRLSALY